MLSSRRDLRAWRSASGSSPIPAGLTSQAWHLFAIFAAAIFSVILTAFPLLTAAMLAAGAAVLTGTIAPAKAFAGFANGSVLLVVVAFLVASSVVKSGLGRRISFLVVSAFGRSTLGLAYSIFLTDAAIAPALPEQHRPQRRALSDRAFARAGRGLEAGRREPRGGSAAI